MAKKKVGVFVSFEYKSDYANCHNFYSQAKRGDSRHSIKDYSLKERRKEDEWLKYAEKQIRKSKLVVVIVGKNTHNAPGVDDEVKIANRLNKPIFQIRPKTVTAGAVEAVDDVIRWKWKLIDVKIDAILDKKQNRWRR